MPVRQMNEGQISEFSRAMEVQGVKVTRTKKGLFLRLPDGTSAMKHFTESDVRGPKNLTSVLRRAGITVPGERTADLPPYITSGSIRDDTKKKVYDWVRGHDYPAIVYAKDYVAETKVDPASANRHLHHSGFAAENAVSKKKGRPWRTPDWLLAEKVQEQNQREEEEVVHLPTPGELIQFTERGRRAQAAVNAVIAEHNQAQQVEEAEHGVGSVEVIDGEEFVEVGPPVASDQPMFIEEETAVEPERNLSEPEPVLEPRGREFLDTHDSWVVSLEELLGYTWPQVDDKLKMLKVLGLDYEFRVWRTSDE